MQLKILILFLLLTSVLLLLIRVAIRNRNKGQSVLNEHASAFKKPDIENVNKAFSKGLQSDASFSDGVISPDESLAAEKE
jgi:hypothetical protein